LELLEEREFGSYGRLEGIVIATRFIELSLSMVMDWGNYVWSIAIERFVSLAS